MDQLRSDAQFMRVLKDRDDAIVDELNALMKQRENVFKRIVELDEWRRSFRPILYTMGIPQSPSPVRLVFPSKRGSRA